MWTISNLKQRGKQAYKKNYWRAVLVALIITCIGGTQGSSIVSGMYSIVIQGTLGGLIGDDDDTYLPSQQLPHNSFNDDYDYYMYDYDYDDDFDDFFRDYGPQAGYDYDEDLLLGVAAIMLSLLVVVVIVMLVIIICSILVRIFLYNPLEVGAMRFMNRNLTEDGQIAHLGFAFDQSYKNQVKVMFFRSLYTLLWSLLFLIPGIYKGYEYRMIPYLLSEYPNLSKEQAFAISKQMMYGEKWKAFLLDLSFIGWWLLNALTLGILGIFYVGPYYHSTAAALYEALKGYKGIPGIMGPMWANSTPWPTQNNTTDIPQQ